VKSRATHGRGPIVRSDVIRIAFSLLMSSFLGGPINPQAVREKVARTREGEGFLSCRLSQLLKTVKTSLKGDPVRFLRPLQIVLGVLNAFLGICSPMTHFGAQPPTPPLPA
jgi:hypothetical protein